MRNIFIGSGSSLICDVEVSYPKQDTYVDAVKPSKCPSPLDNLIGRLNCNSISATISDSMELCKLSYHRVLEKIDGLSNNSFDIYR